MRKLIYLMLILMLIISACKPKEEEQTPDNIISAEDVQLAEARDTILREQWQPKRGYGYGNMSGQVYLIDEIFKKLPPLPEDMYKYRYQLLIGGMDSYTLCNIEPKYYLQPEFYAQNFEEIGVKKYQNIALNKNRPQGYRTYPHQMETYTQAGSEFKLCTLFSTEFGVQGYQGFEIIPEYPSTTMVGKKQYNATQDAQKYIEIVLEPTDVLIEPTYVFFEMGWATKINMTVRVKPEAPNGVYIIGWDVVRPRIEKSIEWKELYGPDYFTPAAIGTTVTQFIAVITVD